MELTVSDIGRVSLAPLEHLAYPRFSFPQQTGIVPPPLHLVQRCLARLVSPIRPCAVLPSAGPSQPAADGDANYIHRSFRTTTGRRRMGQSRSGSAVHYRSGYQQYVDLAVSR